MPAACHRPGRTGGSMRGGRQAGPAVAAQEDGGAAAAARADASRIWRPAARNHKAARRGGASLCSPSPPPAAGSPIQNASPERSMRMRTLSKKPPSPSRGGQRAVAEAAALQGCGGAPPGPRHATMILRAICFSAALRRASTAQRTRHAAAEPRLPQPPNQDARRRRCAHYRAPAEAHRGHRVGQGGDDILHP